MMLMRKLKFLVFVILVSLPANPLYAQEKSSKEEKKAARKARKQKKIDEGKLMVMPLAGPAYTPELELTIAATAMISFKTNPKDSLIQRSSTPLVLGGSSTGAFFGSSVVSTFWFEDKMRIYGDFWFKDMPDNYWGVGYEDGKNTVKSDSTTKYQRFWWWINPRILWQFKKNYFVGLNIDYNYTKGSEESDGVLEDPDYAYYNDRPLNSGLGLIFQYDSRDIPVNAWSGYLLNLSATMYSTGLGGDNDYQIYLLDFRKYIQIKRQGRTFALQAKTRLGYGDVPYGEMSQLGTPFDLRGYTWGRYRDNSMLFFLGEYRHMFMKKSGDLSPHGFVVWAGAGSVGKDFGDFANWLPNFGIGYRLEIQPRMNLRIDIGFGTETRGFYFNFNEAF